MLTGNGKIRMVVMVEGEKLMKFKIGLLQVLVQLPMSFGIMEPKICTELVLKGWWVHFYFIVDETLVMQKTLFIQMLNCISG